MKKHIVEVLLLIKHLIKRFEFLVPIVVILLLSATAIYLAQKQSSDLRENILNNIEYSIGTVTKYVNGHGGLLVSRFNVAPADPHIDISFKAKNLQINTNSKDLLMPNMEVELQTNSGQEVKLHSYLNFYSSYIDSKILQ